jgi:hypothetical protein
MMNATGSRLWIMLNGQVRRETGMSGLPVTLTMQDIADWLGSASRVDGVAARRCAVSASVPGASRRAGRRRALDPASVEYLSDRARQQPGPRPELLQWRSQRPRPGDVVICSAGT